jgi:hypothetical protein
MDPIDALTLITLIASDESFTPHQRFVRIASIAEAAALGLSIPDDEEEPE